MRELIPHAVYQGCGLFWVKATYLWDEGTEVAEFWWYTPYDAKSYPASWGT